MQGLLAHAGAQKVSRADLAGIVLPAPTTTHKPISHVEVVEEIERALSYRRISITEEEFAITPDGMRMFGFLKLDAEFSVGNFAIGLRNSNDKSMRLGLAAGYRVFVCDNMSFSGDFKPVLAKHTANVRLDEVISLGIDRIHRNFTSIEQGVGLFQAKALRDEQAKAIMLDAFMDKRLAVPRHLIAPVHRHYFEPQHDEFRPRNLWSLANAFTSAFKELKPVRQFEVTAKLTPFLHRAAGLN
jgi:hypothetical protein